MNEQYYEKLLNISTSKIQSSFYDSHHYNRYEATPYEVLSLLFDNYKLTSDDSIVDFGCGKGRLLFYINYYFNCKTTGIEMNKEFIDDCISNKNSYFNKNRKKYYSSINFINCFAEEYQIKHDDNRFYFFNPFSLEIFTKVLKNIQYSLEENYRPIDLILYYPSEDYIYYLENYTSFSLYKNIPLNHISMKNPRETITVYRLDYSSIT